MHKSASLAPTLSVVSALVVCVLVLSGCPSGQSEECRA